jgi:SAM-dependent methyltransferase
MPGFALDAGCAVGRFAFEMAKKSDFVVGIDNSRAFVHKARELMKSRQLRFSVPDEGALVENFVLELPEAWDTDRVEFILGDAEALPFRSGIFSSLASLNLIDKVPTPIQHLDEMNRVARKNGAHLLISDPFSWSADVAREEDWLGGTTKGAFSGKGFDNVRSLLTGVQGDLLPSWVVEDEGHIWWKIRNHRNHFELIRSCYIKAGR